MIKRKLYAAGFGLGAALALYGSGAGPAVAYTEKLKSACSNDYYRFCPSHPVGSTSLRQCMHQVGKRLSGRCLNALHAAGEIPRSKR